MKRILSFILLCAMALSLAACGQEPTADPEKDSETQQQDEGGQSQDQGESVTITLPASFFTEADDAQLEDEVARMGYQSYTRNADGSVSYTMSAQRQEQLLSDLSDAIAQSMAGMSEGSTAVEGIEDIEYNDDVSQVTVIVDDDDYDALDEVAVLTIYMMGANYQGFAGVLPEDIDITISIVDEDSGETVETLSYQNWES